MSTWLNDLLSDTNNFMPHGACYLWQPSILWLHIIADSIIAIAYYSIPFALFYFVKKRTDLAYRWVFVLFAAFIWLCGTTHLVSIWTIWHPDYWLDGIIKLITAIASIVTALLVWPLIPKLLQLPSPQALQNSEAYLRAIFDATPDAMLISDEQGTITLVNKQIECLLGYQPDELLGQSIEILVPERYRERHSALRAQFAAAAIARPMGEGREVKALCKNGCELDVEISLSPIKTANGLFFASALRDITERKKSESILRLSEERFRRMANSTPVMIWITDAVGEPTFVNQSWLDFTGLDSLQAMSHRSWIDTIHPDDRNTAFSGYYHNIQLQNIITTEYRLRNSHGEWRWILDKGIPLHDENGVFTGYIGSAVDITERKKTETEREQFFKFFNLARDLQCIIGLDGYFKQINPTFTKTLGYSKTEILQTPFIELVLPEDRPRALEEVKKLQQIEWVLDFENRYLCKNGSFCWLSWKVVFEPIEQLIYAVARDVTDAKKNEEKLQLAELVYQNSIEAILVTDADSRIIAANPAFTEISGYPIEEVLGENPKIFQSGRYDQSFYQAMWEEINTKGKWQGEIWDKRKNGELHAKFLSINAVLDKEGQVHRYLALFSDITARKHYEEEIKRLSDSELNKAKLEAEKSNRAKSEFLSSMSHELRTPMNAVLGFAQLLEFEELTEDQSDSVQQILTAGHHLLDLINEVLDLSKIEANNLELKLEKMDLAIFMQSCITLVQPLTFKDNIKIIDDIIGCHCMVMADALQLKQVLLNLISNAIKYNRVEGSIRLSCEKVNRKTVRINVADTGNGLSPAQIAKLFQPFERLSAKNSNIEGSGIGLCISKKLIEGMNGTIGAESTEGEGSCFWVEIPLA